ncbi:hypothetical protein FGADI_10175 [Fusarium gaditjirri]|uniref:Uncharacterized protein n=1 Tax=Fusarium gaditjirri TaxID=282569 RepID=A0A8H4SY21_9HYPO|nr:hypothetical protein FGADI_10175 [Fusarium gaditjirri]
MAPAPVPVLTITSPTGEQQPTSVLCFPPTEEELASTPDLFTVEDDISSAPASSAPGQPKLTSADVKAMTIKDILAIIRRKVEDTIELKVQEKEDVAYSSLPDSLAAALAQAEKEKEKEENDEDEDSEPPTKRRRTRK